MPEQRQYDEEDDLEIIETRERYRHFLAVPTRWADNDVYGHVNNVVYYSFFDTVVNDYLIDQGGLDIVDGPVIGVVVETKCRYRASIAFPDIADCGLRIGRLGNTSVRFEIGIFRRGDDNVSAWGHFVHVFVNRETRKPVPIPGSIRTALLHLAAT